MKQTKKENRFMKISICAFIVFVFIVSIVNFEKFSSTSMTSASINLSNKKIGWGIKRAKDHKTPDLGAENKKILEQYNGVALGNVEKNKIYLTFDEGYEAGYTEQILDTLKGNNVTATFFITAHYLNSAEDLVRKMIENGNTVGNHTVNHKSMPDLPDEKIKTEVMDLHTRMCEKLGYEMKYIRPPMGEFSERTLSLINSMRIQNSYVVACI